MSSFRFTFGRSPVLSPSRSDGADTSSNVNLDWLLSLNKNLEDGSPDAQRFREIIGAEAIGVTELVRWLEQARGQDDLLHARAYSDLVVCIGRLLGYRQQYGFYQFDDKASHMFSGLWRSERIDLGLLVHQRKLETLDIDTFRRGYDDFIQRHGNVADRFTCLFVLGHGCSRKVEGILAPWLAAGRVRLLKGDTLLELIRMVQYGLLSLVELDGFLGAGQIMYVEDLISFVHQYVWQDGASVERATPASSPIEEPVHDIPSYENHVATAQDSEPSSQEERLIEESEVFVAEDDEEEEPISVVVPQEPQEDVPQSHQQSNDDTPNSDSASLAAIRDRVAALGGDDEVVVVEDGSDEPSPVEARLAALDAVSPPVKSPQPEQKPPVRQPDAPSSSSAKQRAAKIETTPPSGGGDVAADISALEKVIEQNPGNMPAHVQLGKLYARTGQFDKAIDAIKKVINEESDHIQANLVLGEIHYRKGEYPKAALSYDVVLNKDGENVDALVSLGKVYAAQEKYSRALKVLQQAQKVAPVPNAEIELQMAKVYYVQDKLDEALVHMKKARDIDPRNVNVYLALGHYYLDTKNPVEAKKAFEAGLELDPGNIKLQTYVSNLQ